MEQSTIPQQLQNWSTKIPVAQLETSTNYTIEKCGKDYQGFEKIAGGTEYLMKEHGRNVALLTVREGAENLEPHLQYFPHATTRDKYWCVPVVIDHLKKSKNVLIMTRFHKCFDGWVKRGKIRKVGFLEGMSCGTVHIYQAVKCLES